MDFAADLNLFVADFGINAVVGGVSVRGIFDNAFVEQLGVEGLRPTFTAPTASLPAVSHGTVVTINAVSYRSIGVQPDGTGVTLLILERT
ncbi:MAG: hypothetical protein AB1409_08175 [Pseudomonadota bacterium]